MVNEMFVVQFNYQNRLSGVLGNKSQSKFLTHAAPLSCHSNGCVGALYPQACDPAFFTAEFTMGL